MNNIQRGLIVLIVLATLTLALMAGKNTRSINRIQNEVSTIAQEMAVLHGATLTVDEEGIVKWEEESPRHER